MSKEDILFGAVPTPKSIVKLMVDLVFQNMESLTSKKQKKTPFFVLDHSVGDGRFLFEFCIKWKKNVSNKDNLHLHGLDIDETSIARCIAREKTLSTSSEISFAFKTGNALIGYSTTPKENNPEISIREVDESFFNTINNFDPEFKGQIQPFHWFREWPDPGVQGGYDICIGNPPFGISFSKIEKFIYKRLYKAIDPEIESYILFVERSIELLKKGGILVLLIPNNFVTNLRYIKFRKFLLENLIIQKIIMLKENIFSHVSVETCILVGYKNTHFPHVNSNKIEFSKYSVRDGFSKIKYNEQNQIMNHQLHFLLPQKERIYEKIQRIIENKSMPLGEIMNISRGIELGFNSSRTSNNPISPSSVPLVACRNIHPFFIDNDIRYIDFDTEQKAIFKDKSLYLQPKILLRRIGHDLIAAYDKNNLFCVCDVYILTPKPQWSNVNLQHLESMLNSFILTFYLNQEFKSIKKIFPKIPINYLRKLPMKLPLSKMNSQKIEKLLKPGDGVLPSESVSKIDQIISEHYGVSRGQLQLIYESLVNR